MGYIVRLLDLVKFFLPLLPECETSDERISIDEKIMFTLGAGVIFLLGQLPVYGLVSQASFLLHDPIAPFRSVLASEKGTLFELGLLPAFTAAFVWQLAAGFKLINVNLNLRSDRELYQTGQKLTAFLLSIIYAFGLIASGYYDGVLRGYDPLQDGIPYGKYFLTFLQVVSWSFIVTLIIEVFDKGFAFGGGALSLLAVQVSTNIVRETLGLDTFNLPNSDVQEPIGALAVILRKVVSLELTGLPAAIKSAFVRTNLPNLVQFYVSILSVLIVMGLQNVRIELPIRSTKVRGMANIFPIKLLYTGALPIIFAYTVLANIQIFGYFTIHLLNGYAPALASVLGSYTVDPVSNNLVLTSGVLSYLVPPTGLINTVLTPIRSVIFSGLVILLSTWFGYNWSFFSGSSPKDIAKQFKDQGISMPGKRDVSITHELSRIIPVAAVLGAFILAVVVIVSEFMGGVGRGAGVIAGVSAALAVLEEFMVDLQQNGGASQLASAFTGR